MIETIVIIICIAVPSIVFHECAHGFAAFLLGDTTARDAGRLTLNPLKHIDLVGTILIPGGLLLLRFLGILPSIILFGWAKPVPVNFSRLQNPRRDMILVSLAGPTINIVLAFVLIQVNNIFRPVGQIQEFVVMGIVLNLMLACFNLLPIPPLDGSKVVIGLLPIKWARVYASFEKIGFIVLIILLNIGGLRFLSDWIFKFAFFMGLR